MISQIIGLIVKNHGYNIVGGVGLLFPDVSAFVKEDAEIHATVSIR